jgi:putative acetyltransferase
VEEIRIRPAESTDARAILETRHAAILRSAASSYTAEELNDWAGPVTSERVQQYETFLVQPPETTIVAELDGQVVGYAIFRDPGKWHALEPRLHSLYVHSDYSGRGIGSRLLDAIERIARERGHQILCLNNVTLNSREFYAKRGYVFQCESVRTWPSGGQIKSVRMTKTL